jgi:CheY-like chemotaxis protein
LNKSSHNRTRGRTNAKFFGFFSRLLKDKQTAYRALVTDIHLAKPDGWDVARAAREIDPAFPIVYMTGAAADEWGSKGVPNSVLISKPFAPVQLVTAVSHLLNASPPTAPTE